MRTFALIVAICPGNSPRTRRVVQRRCAECFHTDGCRGNCQRGHDQHVPADEHRDRTRDVEPVGIAGQATKRGTVVVRLRCIRVDHFGQAVGTGVED